MITSFDPSGFGVEDEATVVRFFFLGMAFKASLLKNGQDLRSEELCGLVGRFFLLFSAPCHEAYKSDVESDDDFFHWEMRGHIEGYEWRERNLARDLKRFYLVIQVDENRQGGRSGLHW